MIKYITVLWVFILSITMGFTQNTRVILSDKAEISLLTCSPGDELYSLFGHSAIRVQDSIHNIDWVFNYGTFDFRTENFYIKYAQGLLPYQLSISSYQNFLMSYIYENRSVWEQTLELDSISRQKMMDLLIENYKPENRTYLYSFLFDNCSTRIRDLIGNVYGDNFVWNLEDMDKSYWNLLDEYLYRMPWVKWGIHNILGQPGNRKAPSYDYMFLPDYLMLGVDVATDNNEKICAETTTLFKEEERNTSNNWLFSPAFVFSILTILIIVVLYFDRSSYSLKTISFILFLVAGLLGVLIIFLGFFTKHPITAPNWNIIWASPLNLLVPILLFKRRTPRLLKYYLTFYSVTLLLAIPLWFFLQPAVPLASLPLIILYIYLSYRIISIKN